MIWVVNHCAGGNHGNGWHRRLTTLLSVTVHLLQRTAITTASEFGEFDNVEDCDAAQLINFVLHRSTKRCLTAPADELVGSARLLQVKLTCKKNPHDFNSINIIVWIIDVIFINFISDHGISGIMPFEVFIIRNNRASRRTVHASASSNYFW